MSFPVYLFRTATGNGCGLSVKPDGSNLSASHSWLFVREIKSESELFSAGVADKPGALEDLQKFDRYHFVPTSLLS